MLEHFLTYINLYGFILALAAFFRPELEGLFHRILNQIDIYMHSHIEVGFYDYGPSIGMDFTIRGRGGDQLLNSMSLKLIRERDNATYNYKWSLFRKFSASQTGAKVEANIQAELASAFLLQKKFKQ